MHLLFAKYNRHRLPRFQIETLIVETQGRRQVVKKALTPDAATHLADMARGYDLLRRLLRPGCCALPARRILEDGTQIFDYVEGESVDSLLARAFFDRDKPRFFATVDAYRNLLAQAFDPAAPWPSDTPEFRTVFGLAPDAPPFPPDAPLVPAVIDLVFENILVQDGRYALIDPEWVFEGKVPLSFILFRALFYFCEVKFKELDFDAWLPFDEVLAACGLTPEQAGLYRAMDDAFQAHVFGAERCFAYRNRYRQPVKSLAVFEQTIARQHRELEACYDSNMKLYRTVQDRDATIAAIFNTRAWRLTQRLGRTLDRLCPPGTARRNAVERLVSALAGR